jgi:hypothetical protein
MPDDPPCSILAPRLIYLVVSLLPCLWSSSYAGLLYQGNPEIYFLHEHRVTFSLNSSAEQRITYILGKICYTWINRFLIYTYFRYVHLIKLESFCRFARTNFIVFSKCDL